MRPGPTLPVPMLLPLREIPKLRRRTLARTLLIALVAGAFASCATKKEEQFVDQGGEVSTIPWNKPQKWEGQGQLGGLSDRSGTR